MYCRADRDRFGMLSAPVETTLIHHFWVWRTSAAQVVEIAAFMRLEHVFQIHPAITPSKMRLRPLPHLKSILDLLVGNQQLQLTFRHIQFDQVPIPDNRKGT